MVRIFNPSPASVVVYQYEEVGVLRPCEEPEEVRTLTSRKGRDGYQGGTSDVGIKEAIAQLIPNDVDLPPYVSEGLSALLHEFSDVISTGDSDLGRTTLTQHRINTSDGDAAPVCQPPRRLPPCQREEAQKLVDDILKRGVIESAPGRWSSPIVLVKKNGLTRFCVNFRKLNAHTKRDAQPIPRVDDTLDTLGQAKSFSTLDLASGYWQVEVAPEDRGKTAFATPDGLFQFKVMPFGRQLSSV